MAPSCQCSGIYTRYTSEWLRSSCRGLWSLSIYIVEEQTNLNFNLDIIIDGCWIVYNISFLCISTELILNRALPLNLQLDARAKNQSGRSKEIVTF